MQTLLSDRLEANITMDFFSVTHAKLQSYPDSKFLAAICDFIVIVTIYHGVALRHRVFPVSCWQC